MKVDNDKQYREAAELHARWMVDAGRIPDRGDVEAIIVEAFLLGVRYGRDAQLDDLYPTPAGPPVEVTYEMMRNIQYVPCESFRLNLEIGDVIREVPSVLKDLPGDEFVVESIGEDGLYWGRTKEAYPWRGGEILHDIRIDTRNHRFEFMSRANDARRGAR